MLMKPFRFRAAVINVQRELTPVEPPHPPPLQPRTSRTNWSNESWGGIDCVQPEQFAYGKRCIDLRGCDLCLSERFSLPGDLSFLIFLLSRPRSLSFRAVVTVRHRGNARLSADLSVWEKRAVKLTVCDPGSYLDDQEHVSGAHLLADYHSLRS